MSSKVEICNVALSMIGGKAMISFTDNTREAILCSRIYNQVVEYVINSGEWTSATRRATLNQLTSTPTYKYSFQYQLPTSPRVVKVVEINEERPGDKDYRIEGSLLLTNESAVDIRYIAFIEDSDGYGAYLEESIVYRLAAILAYPISGSAKLASEMSQQSRIVLASNLSSDGQQGSAFDFESNDLDDVR